MALSKPLPKSNLLHPLVSFEWEKCNRLPMDMYFPQALVCDKSVYFGGGGTGSREKDAAAKLYTFDFNVYSKKIPVNYRYEGVDVPVRNFALAIFESHVTLIGGSLVPSGKVTNKLFTIEKKIIFQIGFKVPGRPTNISVEYHIKETLPPMPTKRAGASAISHGEIYIIVAGGHGSNGRPFNIVEVYNHKRKQWSSAQPLPQKCSYMSTAVHDGRWIFSGGFFQDKKVFSTIIEALIRSSKQSETSQPSVWNYLTDAPHRYSSLAVVHGIVIAVGGIGPHTRAVYSYSFQMQKWIHVGELPRVLSCVCTIVLPTGELLIVGGWNDRTQASKNVFRGHVRVTQEQLTLYFVHPVPLMTQQCMKALFSVSYSGHTYEEFLLEEMKKRFEGVQFQVTTRTVILDINDSDVFELNIPQAIENHGYSLSLAERLGCSLPPEDNVQLKIPGMYVKTTGLTPLDEYVVLSGDNSNKNPNPTPNFPPSLLLQVNPCDPYPTEDLYCKLEVHMATDITSFDLKVETPPLPREQEESLYPYLREEFRKETRLLEYVDKPAQRKQSAYSERLTLKMGDSWREMTLEELEQFRIALSSKMDHDQSLQMYKVVMNDGGTLSVTFLFPKSRDINVNHLQQFLLSHDILNVIVDSKVCLDLEKFYIQLQELVFTSILKEDTKLLRQVIQQLPQQGKPVLDFLPEGNTAISHNYKTYSPLMVACERSSETVLDNVELLLTEGASPSYENKEGLNAVHIACLKGSLEVVKLLLNHVEQSAKLKNVVHYASAGRNVELVKWLLENVEAMKSPETLKQTMKDGKTPLHFAATADSPEMIQLLIDKGCDPAVQDVEGNTALHLACMKDCLRVKEILKQVCNGRLQHIENKDGQKPVDLEPLCVLPPQIITQPSDEMKIPGEDVVLTVETSGSGSLSYQWKKDERIISRDSHPYCTGATSPILQIKSVKSQYEGNYSCVVSNNAFSVESDKALLKIFDPGIIKQPTDQTRYDGDEVALTVTAGGSGTLHYQWSKDGETITTQSHPSYKGATTSKLYISSATQHCDGQYKCVVSNEVGRVESNTVQLKVVSRPRITKLPSDQTKSHGEDAVFTVEASGSGTLSYRWKRDGEFISPDTHPYCTGADTATLLITSVLSQYEGSYSCVVSNDIGSTESQNAQLGVVSELFISGSLATQQKKLPPLAPPKVDRVDASTEKVIKGPDDGFKMKTKPQESTTEEKEKSVRVQIQSFTPSSGTLVELPDGMRMFSPVYQVSTSSKLKAEASIEHYANIKSDKDREAVVVLYSNSKQAPYKFDPLSAHFFSASSNNCTLQLDSDGQYAIGASNRIQERYTLYLVHPVPSFTPDCMCALFSVSYSQHAFEQRLVDVIKNNGFNAVKFGSASHTVSVAKDSDGFELVVPEKLKEKGFSLKAVGQSTQATLKIRLNDLHDRFSDKSTSASSLPPNMMLQLIALENHTTETEEFDLCVKGSTDDSSVTFTLNIHVPPPQQHPKGLGKGDTPGTLSHTVLESSTITINLTKNHLPHLVEVLSLFAGKWKNIGLQLESQLGLASYEMVSKIDGDTSLKDQDGPTAYLESLLHKWMTLSKPDQCTLGAVENALRSTKDKELVEAASNLEYEFRQAIEGKRSPPSMEKGSTLQSLGTDHQTITKFNHKDVISACKLWKLPQLHEAHDGLTGKGIRIAIIDSGIDVQHDAFKKAYNNGRISGCNFVTGESTKDWKRGAPHGSMAAYIAAGDGFEYKLPSDSEDDIPRSSPNGIAPNAHLIICRIGNGVTSKDLKPFCDALKWLTLKPKEERAHIVSMSLGIEHKYDDEEQDEIEELILELHKQKVVCVASCGNYGNNRGGTLFPACLDEVISVGALNKYLKDRMSNPTDGGVDVFAPGENVIAPAEEEGRIRLSCGSSCATPAIAGLIALYMELGERFYDNKEEENKTGAKRYHKVLFYKNEGFKNLCKNANILQPFEYFGKVLKEKPP